MASSLLLVVLGCRRAPHASNVPSGAAAPAPIAAPAPAHGQPFALAVSAFRKEAQLLGAAPRAVDDANARGAVGSLADALAVVPHSEGVDVTDAAVTMREHYVHAVGATGPVASRRLREALLVAAGVMTQLAKGPYSCEPAVERRVHEFERAARAVNPAAGVREQPHAVARALARAGAALASLERASSRAGAAQPTGVTERQVPEVTPRVAPFAAALARYSDAVDALALTAPDQVPISLRRALDELADVLKFVPEGAPSSAHDQVAAIRTYAADMAAAPAQSAAQTSFGVRALDSANLLLTLVATEVVERAPVVADEIGDMRDQMAGIDAQRPIGPQISALLGALEAAGDALRTMAVDPAH